MKVRQKYEKEKTRRLRREVFVLLTSEYKNRKTKATITIEAGIMTLTLRVSQDILHL